MSRPSEAHEGRWVEHESFSGQDDTAWIQCSCGWQSREIWSTRDIARIKQSFKDHADAKA